MCVRRAIALGCFSLGMVVAAASQSYAEWTGTCSCKSEGCHGRWQLRAASVEDLHHLCSRRTDEHGFLSRVHRVHHS
jgi:hypothetical protein